MGKIASIRFKPGGKIYDFDCCAFVVKPGDNVIVETEQGLGFGVVATSPVPQDEKIITTPLKKIFRMANENDLIQREKNIEFEEKAFDFCLGQIKEFGLEMNLFSVEGNFDLSKMTFFFTAEGRVDFRKLVKMLVKEFGTKIEMRQVGIRNQAKMFGGIGRCGREICCSLFLRKFEPVSIRVAKEQGLSLNPTKISGQCGRLMCCLIYENETYLKLKEKFPKIGKEVEIESGKGKIVRHNVIVNRVVVRLEDGIEIEIPVDKIQNVSGDEKECKEPST